MAPFRHSHIYPQTSLLRLQVEGYAPQTCRKAYACAWNEDMCISQAALMYLYAMQCVVYANGRQSLGKCKFSFSHVEKFQLVMICVYFEFQHGSEADHPIACSLVSLSSGEWMKLIFNQYLATLMDTTKS